MSAQNAHGHPRFNGHGTLAYETKGLLIGASANREFVDDIRRIVHLTARRVVCG